MKKYKLVLNAFDGEGAAAPSGDGGAMGVNASQDATVNRANGENPTQTDASSETGISFEDYMSQHKDEASKWFQERFDKRHKDYKNLQERVKSTDNVLDMLATKFGIEDRTDIAAITQALENDDYLYAERAEANNRTIEEQRTWDQMERENRLFREQQQMMQRQQQMERQMNEWEQQSNNLKQLFPTFDLEVELQNPDFQNALRSGLSMERAYYAIHGAEITSGAMEYTAAKVRQATAEDLATRRNRPAENGLSGQAAAKVSKDVHKLSKSERAAMAKQSLNGPIRF